MTQAPFEQYINKILNQHDALDLLKQTALNSPEHHTNLQSSVDRILIENHVDAYTSSISYETAEKQVIVLRKLIWLKKLLISKSVSENSVYYITIEHCIENVNMGRSLSKDLLIFLNKVRTAYDRA